MVNKVLGLMIGLQILVNLAIAGGAYLLWKKVSQRFRIYGSDE